MRTSSLLLVALLAACGGKARGTTPREMPSPSIQVGACGSPGRDGVMSSAPKVDRADRDLDGDGNLESIVVDRSMCSAEGNCYWNVFVRNANDSCVRYAGTFWAAALEMLESRGEDNMTDVRGYYNLHDRRLRLESYRFVRGGYQIVDSLACRREADDRLDCVDDKR